MRKLSNDIEPLMQYFFTSSPAHTRKAFPGVARQSVLQRTMFWRAIAASAVIILSAGIAIIPQHTVLPSGWTLAQPPGAVLTLGTMPQGLSLSPDGTRLAVVEAGYSPPAVRIVDARTLRLQMTIPLEGAFGRPVWSDPGHIAVAGAQTDAIAVLDLARGTQRRIVLPRHTWPAAVAAIDARHFASADDGDGTVWIDGRAVTVGSHPSDLVVAPDRKTLFVAVRAPSRVIALDIPSRAVRARIPVGLHPQALLLSRDGKRLYAAESDDDAVAIINTRSFRVQARVAVGLRTPATIGVGSSPNALALSGNALFVSLGGENAVALVRDNRVVRRIATGWYPTGVAVGADGMLYVLSGKGQGAPANPQFDPLSVRAHGYVGENTIGSLWAIARSDYDVASSPQLGLPQWSQADPGVIRAHGPIAHVIYVIKENRTYDQVLGDLAGTDGDSRLAMFGENVTPNQHAIAQRFGMFDNAYVDSQVSANGHSWTDAAFANDYVERFWPSSYGDRRETYDYLDGSAPDVPHNGYLWDAALRAHVTFRDYGEAIDFSNGLKLPVNTFPGLAGHFDPRFIGWDLTTSDTARYNEWAREFNDFVANRDLPQLEIVYFPNDHTAGTKPGYPTPRAYVALNDVAVGKLVDTVSHSPYWMSTAIFVLEDDAQAGPDHVSDQRSTFYIASPFARGGLDHTHYSTTSFLHTMEILLGVEPLSNYDAAAQPLYAAFAPNAVNAQPYDARMPAVNMAETNKRTAYKARESARMDFSRPDAADAAALSDVLEHSP